MKPVNLYLSGVGGQGIGLLSQVLLRALVETGHRVKGVDTHGLAQRHGTVVSQIRAGDNVFTPMVPLGRADLVISLERLEAFRAAGTMLRTGGTVVYYDSVYQPVLVRLGAEKYPGNDELDELVSEREGRLERVLHDDLPDARMQNVAVLARVADLGTIEGVDASVVRAALGEVLPDRTRDANLELFDRLRAAP